MHRVIIKAILLGLKRWHRYIALAILPEVKSSMPSNYMAAYN